MPPALRSIFAVVVGFMAMIVMKMMFTLILVKTMTVDLNHPSLLYLAVVVVCTLLAATFGGFVTGALAQTRPIEHAAAMGAIVFLMGWISYNHYQGPLPTWFHWVVGTLPPFLVLTGSALYTPRGAAARR